MTTIDDFMRSELYAKDADRPRGRIYGREAGELFGIPFRVNKYIPDGCLVFTNDAGDVLAVLNANGLVIP